MLVVSASPARTALKNSQLPCDETWRNPRDLGDDTRVSEMDVRCAIPNIYRRQIGLAEGLV
jgi:hypothetical protein